METLLAIQQRNAVYVALGDVVLEDSRLQARTPASRQEMDSLVDIVIALLDTFGSQEFVEGLKVLCRASQHLLQPGMIEALAANASLSPPKRPRFDLPEQQTTRCSVSLEGIQLAESSLEDFVQSYMPLHGIDTKSPRELFKYLPTLVFVEGHLYDLDQANEDTLHPYRGSKVSAKLPMTDPCGRLRATLQQRGLWSPRLDTELEYGSRFWALERQLCRACKATEDDKGMTCGLFEEALHLKSFDYRVLNLLLYAMQHRPVDEELLSFLQTSEVLVEIGDDLVDYHEDVERNSFNIYRCFLALYGCEQGQKEMMAFIGRAEAAYAKAFARLDPVVAVRWMQSCQESNRHCLGCERGPGGGTWELPDPIPERREACV